MRSFIRTAFAVGLISQAIAAPSQTTKNAGDVHGTINIFLANGSGLVAITDSRLSNETGTVGFGQKLFKVDDQTVCAIAGFFSWPGPVFPGNKTNLLPTAVPAVLNAYIKTLHDPRVLPESLQDKFAGIAKAWAFDLNMMLEFGAIAKQLYIPPQASVITIGGYDKGALWIGQVSLMAVKINGAIRFVLKPANPVLHRVGNALGYATAGYDSEVLSILAKPGSISDSDPIFAKYSKSMATNDGASLTLNDLETLAKKLEAIPAAKYNVEVGGDQQLAVLTGGKVSFFDSPPATSLGSLGQKSIIEVLLVSNNQYHGGDVMGLLPPQRVDYYYDDYFSKAVVQLDDRIEIYSTFSDCTLFYDGSPLVLFGNNQLRGTDLLLGPKASLDSPFVKEFERMYPKVHITQSTGRIQKTHSGMTIYFIQ